MASKAIPTNTAAKTARKPRVAAPKRTAAAGPAKTSRRTGAIIGAAAAGMVAGVAVNLGRKVAVQAPSALAGDWFEALKAEHRAALAIFDAIQATSDDQTIRRTLLLTQLKHALSKHAFVEENVIYPALRDIDQTVDADELNREHGYVKQHLYDLDNMEKTSLAFLGKVAAFRRDIEEHVHEEETRIFPALHAKLGEKNKTLTAAANREGFKIA